MYLPEGYTHQTVFPKSFDKDLAVQVRLVRERWHRFYPLIDFHAFRGDVVPATTPSSDPLHVVGMAGGSAFDPLWGETVDPAQLVDGVWKQPHGSGGVAANPEVFYPMQRIHAQIRREAKQKELKLYGFDLIRDLLVIIPTCIMDEHGLHGRAGDEFVWDGDRYIVKQTDTAGYWKNTNIRLYVGMNCEHKKAGS